MNNKIATGIWLVFAGGVFLLHNIQLIDFNFASVINLWPLLLVSMGVGLLLQNRPHAKILVIATNILLCAFVFYHGITNQKRTDYSSGWSGSTTEEPDHNYHQQATKAWDDQIQSAQLTLNGGASKYAFSIGADSSTLIAASTKTPAGALQLKSSGEQNVDIELNSTRPSRGKHAPIAIKLHKKPLWNFIFNVGASSITGDLRALRIGNIELHSGASALQLHLPKPQNGTSRIAINTAASKIKLYLPKNAQCRVETESIISNNKFEGLDIVDGNKRKSAGFDATTDKYDIEVSGAANSLSILRY